MNNFFPSQFAYINSMSHLMYNSKTFESKLTSLKSSRPRSAYFSSSHSSICNHDTYLETLKSKPILRFPSSSQVIDFQSDDIFNFVEAKSLHPKEIESSLVPKGEFPSANSYFHQAYKLRSKGDFDNALTYYRQALNIDPKHLPSRVNIGICMMKLHMIEAAIENFKTVEEQYKHEGIPYFNQAICHMYLQEFDEAIKVLNIPIRFLSEEENKDYISLKALALFRSGRVNEALELVKSKAAVGNNDKEDYDMTKSAYNSLFPYKISNAYNVRRPRTNNGVRKLLSELKPNAGIKIKASKQSKMASARTASSLIGSTRISSAVNTQRPKKTPRLASAYPKLMRTAPRKSFLTGGPETTNDTKEIIISPKSVVSVNNTITEDLPTYEEIVAKKRMFDDMIAESEAILSSIVPVYPKKNVIENQEIGFFQEEMGEKVDYKQEILNDEEKKEKIEKIKKEFQRDLEDTKSVFIEKSNLIEEIVTAKISIQNLRYIEEQFAKEPEERNYSELSKILAKLPFFAKFPGGVRVQLLKKSLFKIYNPAATIISQGELGDYMFVIVNGAVEIKKKSPDFGSLEITINSMYDGETFGELALLADPTGMTVKRTASCIANERTMLIALSKDDYKHILLEQMQNDIIGKVDFFKTLPFFTGSEGLSLIPLASNIEPIIYKINEPIIQAGEIPKGLYIIYKGRCMVYWEGYSLKPKEKSLTINPRLRNPIPRPFFTGNYVPPTADIKEDPEQLEEKINEKLFYRTIDLTKPDEVEKASNFLGTSKISDLSKTNSIFKERIEFYNLKEGDYFGARGLLEGHTGESQNGAIIAEPAKFTVVSESQEVKVFILRKKHLGLLTEKTMEQLKIVLANHYEIDCPKQWSNDYLRTAFTEWQSYKLALIQDIHKERFIEKNKTRLFISKK
ncbi:unnamed protein product [Blepharisma stoltei]|uniref:Cyclic nucleotide-binding domain-containing protein n=1 Tax=Blepharisma stoltei TaxID=1481888 RepID=A0AAU9KCL5_9CILI|nr:unnamed protein product [Blepharisma stoltei]